MPAATQTRRIIISVDSKDKQKISDIANDLGRLNQQTKSLASGMSFLTNAFRSWLGYLGVREIVNMSDEMQNLGNRLKIVSQAGEDTSKIMQDILRTANETNQSVANVAEVYTRLGSSLKSANASSASLLALTKELINSFRVSGSTGTETTATIIQLSQAFASGTLRGQELRSVLLQNAELARLLRERFGSGLAEKAEKGLISVTEVLKILRDNLTQINQKAQVLAPTFEQTLTKAMNNLSIAVFTLNKEFDLSGKFAKGMDIVTEKIGLIGVALGLLAATQIPALIGALETLSIRLFVFATINPVIAAITALAIGIVLLVDNFDDLKRIGDQVNIALNNFLAGVLDIIGAVTKLGTYVPGISALFTTITDATEEAAKGLRSFSKSIEEDLNRPKVATTKPIDDQKKAINDLIAAYSKLFPTTGKEKKVKEILGEINTAFLNGTINVEEYNKRLVNFELFKLNKEFKEGKKDIFAYNQAFGELRIQELNRDLKNGLITFDQFKDSVETVKLNELNAKFQAGKIGLIEYNEELTKISQKFQPGSALTSGTAAYINSVGTLSQNVASAISATFSHLEDNLVEFVKKGKFNFADFTQAILDDLTRIIIRASIVKPIAESLLGYSLLTPGAGGNYGAAGGSYTDTSVVAAKGMAFDKGIKRFATGGVVDRPTMFRYGGNKTGLMGEKGPEAILPLQRGSGGNLGVAATVTPVTVNVINQTGNEVQQRETTGPSGEKQIDILITNKVRDGISTGKFDSALRQSYGLNRKGL